MDIYDFITRDELDELPEDPGAAFMEFLAIAQRRLKENVDLRLGRQRKEGWGLVEDIYFTFVTVVTGVARQYGLNEIASLQIPPLEHFTGFTYRQFMADLSYCTAQLAVDNSQRKKRESVALSETAKDRIRAYVHALKEAIDKANLTEPKKAALHAWLQEFEAELYKQRTNLMAVTKFVFAMLAEPGILWQSVEGSQTLVLLIAQTIAEEKAAEDETRRLPPVDPPAALLPPRRRSIDDEVLF